MSCACDDVYIRWYTTVREACVDVKVRHTRWITTRFYLHTFHFHVRIKSALLYRSVVCFKSYLYCIVSIVLFRSEGYGSRKFCYFSVTFPYRLSDWKVLFSNVILGKRFCFYVDALYMYIYVLKNADYAKHGLIYLRFKMFIF